MVSLPDKSGNDVLVDTGRIRAATPSGSLPMALMFPSLSSFGDVEGANSASDYVSQRTLQPGTSGWSTHNVFPLQEPLSAISAFLGGEALYMGDPTPDLTKAVFRSVSSLPGTQTEVEKTINLYQRENLRAPGQGAYELLSRCTFACSVSDTLLGPNVRYVAGSDDLAKALFVTPNALTLDTPSFGDPLYKTIGGNPTFVGYVPIPPATQCTGVGPDCVAVPVRSGGGGNVSSTYFPHVLSTDGSKVFFSTESPSNVYMRDDKGTIGVGDDTTTQVNVSERATPAFPTDATYWDATPAGNRAFFTSGEALTEDAPLSASSKLFRWSSTPDGDGHRLIYLSGDEEPADGLGEVLGTLGTSSDGSSVYFLQRGQIVAGEPALGFGIGIYVWRQGAGVRYIGTMKDAVDVNDDLGGSSHSYVSDDQLGARVTPDGRHLLISLHQPPVPGGADHGNCPNDKGSMIEGERGCRQLYLYDFADDSLTCVSCQGLTPPTTPAFFSVQSLAGLSATSSHLNRPISDDGRYVFFSTGQRLVTADTNKTGDAYVFDTAAGEPHLLSSGESKSPSYFVEASSDGRDAFIVTREQLSQWDFDGNRDIYDARVGGGVPEPVPQPRACQGDACQPPPVALADPLPASQALGRAKNGGRRCAKRRNNRKACSRRSAKHRAKRRAGR